MSKVLESRKSSFSLATKKEIELSHLLSLAYVLLCVSHLLFSTICTVARLLAIPHPKKIITENNLTSPVRTVVT
jgi:hypothetical protein